MWKYGVAGVALVSVGCGEAEESLMDEGPQPAPVVTPSGTCPDLSAPGRKTMMSAGQERDLAVYFPKDRPAGMPVLFAWHGISDTSLDPIEQMTTGFGLDDLAEQRGAVIVVPQAFPVSILGLNIALFSILNDGDADLALFDDMRACLKTELDVDLTRVSSWGHSGGGLFTSRLVFDRSDTLAAAVPASAGSDITVPLAGERLEYTSPAHRVPTLLITGGEDDVWPDGMAIIDFEDATDSMQDGLVNDGHFVARCRHDLGHLTLPSWYWPLVLDWAFEHEFGRPSPIAADPSLLPAACDVVGPEMLTDDG